MHLLVPLQVTGEGKSHLAAFKGALVGRQLSVLLTHVRLQLFVFPEVQAAAVVSADVLLVVLAVNAARVSVPVGVGGEGLRAAIYGAEKRLRPGVTELMPRQVIRGAEGLAAALALTGVRLHSGVFAQVCVQLPLFVISGRAVGKRADVPFVRLSSDFHYRGALEASLEFLLRPEPTLNTFPTAKDRYFRNYTSVLSLPKKPGNDVIVDTQMFVFFSREAKHERYTIPFVSEITIIVIM